MRRAEPGASAAGTRSWMEAEAWRLGRDVCWGPSQGRGLGKAEGAEGEPKLPLLFTLSLSPHPGHWIRGVGAGCGQTAGGEGPHGTPSGETEDPKQEGSVAGRAAPQHRRPPPSAQLHSRPRPRCRDHAPQCSKGPGRACFGLLTQVAAPLSQGCPQGQRSVQMPLPHYPVSPPGTVTGARRDLPAGPSPILGPGYDLPGDRHEEGSGCAPCGSVRHLHPSRWLCLAGPSIRGAGATCASH